MLETVMLNPKIAEDNIICYKVVIPIQDKKKDVEFERVKSNVIGYEYKVGVLNETIDICVDNQVYTDVDKTRFLIVKYGYHSYAHMADIAAVSSDQQIRECIIPKGSRYFVDVYEKQIASSNIIITEKIINKK